MTSLSLCSPKLKKLFHEKQDVGMPEQEQEKQETNPKLEKIANELIEFLRILKSNPELKDLCTEQFINNCTICVLSVASKFIEGHDPLSLAYLSKILKEGNISEIGSLQQNPDSFQKNITNAFSSQNRIRP
jgi:hypothetical protein